MFECSFCQVNLFLDRLKGDWDRLSREHKKPWTLKDATNVHIAAGSFIHFQNGLKAHIPKADFDAAATDLKNQFLSGFLDAELSLLVAKGLPSMELRDVSFLRRVLFESIIGPCASQVFF